VNRLNPRPDFVITGGDLIMDALAVDRARIELQWKLFDAGLRGLDAPVHHTIGNHDVGGWSTKRLIKSDDYDYGKKRFADHYGNGNTFRSFDHRGWHFVLLDSIGKLPDGSGYYGVIDEAQLAWLRTDLERTGKQTPVVVVTHIPLFSVWHQAVAGPTKPQSAGALVTNVPEVRAILEPYNVQLVLSGHGHLRERIELTGTTYIQSGAVSGRWWKGRINNEAEAFGVVTCNPDGFTYRYEDYGWQASKG
jgi:3',5'-cyclic AMP phosphodiesterase CpdA